ncbi:MAG TPA: primosomal protein N' [Terriglobales bacterium]|nr:primosomal protein N' [Terriglobales bacterium]
MPAYCDVALPVPLDAVFTYRVGDHIPVVGGRVLVPFRQKRLAGIVVELHDREQAIEIKPIIQVLDQRPVLEPILLDLGKWIASYYIAPLGEVLRTMVPLAAEVRFARIYRITDLGLTALHESATVGSSRRSRVTPEEQMEEYAVLDYLSQREELREQTLRSAVKCSRRTLDRLVAKKWIRREDVSAARDASRTVSVAVLHKPATSAQGKQRKLNSNQQQVLEALAANEGRLAVEHLRSLGIPRSTIESLKSRGLIQIVEEQADFHVSGLKPKPYVHHASFTPMQSEAFDKIRTAANAKKFSVSLLHGVTGSGKTAVYLAAMREVLDAGRAAIMLVPEIGLTPAAAAQLHDTFGDEVAILHSGLTDDERAEQWHRIRRGEARIVVGTRSAVFAPVNDLALIVVDEEHDNSYKQEETPRYHARDVAIMRAKMSNTAVVLGSATPSLESYHNTASKYRLIAMPQRVEERPLPEVELVDMRDEFKETGSEQLISRRLTEEISQRLERNEQVMVLLNRRGYSPIVLCRTCGNTVQCKNCDIPMTHHKSSRRIECHYCGYMERVPEKCPKCGSEYVYFLGAGSEKLEDHLHGLFPRARIARLDRDTIRGRHDFERVLSAMHAGEVDLIVGTQMIAKGHDFPGVTLVGVVGADTALKFPDFRAAERTFQLLTQVAGRAGRGNTPGRVVLQTFFPDHYAIQFASKHDYAGFYEKEINFRRWMKYPPFTALANVLIRSDQLDDALKYSGWIGHWFKEHEPPAVKVMGPAPAPIVRLKRDFRYHFILKSESREKMNGAIRAMLAFANEKKIPRTNIVVDVDAQNLI